MATKQLTEKQARAKFLKALEENDGEASAKEMIQLSGLPAATVKELASKLVKEGVIVPAKGGKVALPVEEEEEEAPAPKKKAPAKKAAAKPAPPAKKKAKPVPPPVEEEDDDEDLDLEDDDDDDAFDSLEDDEDEIEEEDDEEVEEEDDDEIDEEDDDEGLDDDEDEGLDEDEEEEVPAPKKRAAPAKGKGKKPASLEAPHKEFSMAFKPIDTLTDDELLERIENGVAAAESLHKEHPLVSEMLMRSVAKARRQWNKRQ